MKTKLFWLTSIMQDLKQNISTIQFGMKNLEWEPNVGTIEKIGKLLL